MAMFAGVTTVNTKQKLERRGFLGKTAAASLALPMVVPGSALGLEDRPAASERITMGIIGCGSRGRRVLDAFLADSRSQFLAACDVDSRRCAKAKETIDTKLHNTDCVEYVDFRELLPRSDIDAVMIATQDFWHVPMSILACKHGKDVYCEKPLSLTIRESRAVVTVARRYQRVFQVGTQNRSHAAARFGCELVRNGHLGDMQYVEVGTQAIPIPCDLGAEPIPDFLNWDLWLGPVPYRPYHSGMIAGRGWNRYSEFSGGGVTDAGAHFFDLAQWALGKEDTMPVEVRPLDPEKHHGRRVEYRYADGTIMYRHTPGNYIKFVGTQGSIDMVTCAWVRLAFNPKELAEKTIGPNEVHLRHSENHMANFLDCVLSREKPAADVETGCRAAIICHIGNIAQWLDRPLKWDPENERFVGAEEANRWLDRAKREPWRD